MAFLDAKWLEVLKLTGWKAAAVCAASAAFLLVNSWHWMPSLDAWVVQIVTLTTGMLALAAFIESAHKFFPVREWIVSIPDHIWDVLKRHEKEFSYSPPRGRNIEPYPWRKPWNA